MSTLSPITRRPERRVTYRTGLWERWFWAVTAAETAGFLLPAIAAAATSGSSESIAFAVLVLAGAGEGAVLGIGQAWALSSVLPVLSARRWVGATAGAAALAWALGMIPSSAGGVAPQLAVVLGVALLLTMGAFQWVVLREHLAGAGRWIAVTAGAWAAGLAVFFAVSTPLWHEGQAAALVAAIGVLGGLAMAATVAAVSGAGLVHLLKSSSLKTRCATDSARCGSAAT